MKKKSKKILDKKFLKVVSLLSVGVIFIIFLAIYIMLPKLKLSSREIDINVFEDYNGIDYTAQSFGKDIKDKVIIDGTVDTSHIGTYKINYSVNNGIFNVKKELKVNVVDKIPPELNLIGDEEYKVCSIDSFTEAGYSSLDNYDGDITSDVKVEKKDDYIEYISIDSSNNKSEKQRKLIVDDSQAPEIKLNGKVTTYVLKDSTYKDEGAIAKDNCDGDLTNGIETEGSVDTSKLGTYEIKYKVRDSKNNEANVTRKVIVQEKSIVADKNDNNKSGVVYLTFDDGPGSYTASILDTLKKYNIKATFFVTMAGSDEILKREANEGHTIALHTATHNYKIMYASKDAYFNDLNTVANRVKNATGIDTKYIRFPGGSSNAVSKVCMSELTKDVENRGYKYFDWNVSVEDAGGCAYSKDKAGCVLNNFKKYLNPNRANVVLMHDIKSYTAQALPQMIDYAKSKGFSFQQIDDNAPTAHHRTKC